MKTAASQMIEVDQFDYLSGDLNAYLNTVNGLDPIFREKMLNALHSDHHQMDRIKMILSQITFEIEQNLRFDLMTKPFFTGFTAVFNMNAHPEYRIFI